MNSNTTSNEELFISRELSWLDFNSRVLDEAQTLANPLLERLKFVAIFSSNLDEFFSIRIAGLRQQIVGGKEIPDPAGLLPSGQLKRARAKIERLLRRQYRCLNSEIIPELEENNIYLKRPDELNKQEQEHLKSSLESILKDGIPRHYAREKSVKIYGILTIIFAVLSAVALTVSIITENSIIFVATSVLAVAFLVCILSYTSNKERVTSYNVALDLFDSYETFNLSVDANIKILKQYINYGVSYLNNSSELSLTPLLSSVIDMLYEEDEVNAEKFINNTKNASKYVKKG